MAIGNIMGGMTMQQKGGEFLFSISGFIALGYCIFHVILTLIVRYLDKKKGKFIYGMKFDLRK